MLIKCVYCGKEVESKRSDKKYCSYACQNRARYTDSVCLNCGETFRKCGKTVKCCSQSCSKQYEWQNKKRQTLDVSCVVCGNIFKKRITDLKKTEQRNGKNYCSRKCMGESYKNRVTLTCSQCGIEFQRAKSGVDENNKHYFCSKRCQAINTDYILSGADHWHYINGETCYIRGENWNEVRRLVRERDNNTCQKCGATQENLLDVHHIKPYRLFDDYLLANDLSNLITYCPSCHHSIDAQISKKEKGV